MNTSLLDNAIADALHSAANDIVAEPNVVDLVQRMDASTVHDLAPRRFTRRAITSVSVAATTVIVLAAGAAAMLGGEEPADVRVTMPAEASSTTVAEKTTTTVAPATTVVTVPATAPEVRAPGIEVIEPKSGTVVTLGQTVTLRGRSEAGAGVYVNGVPVAVGEDGIFNYAITVNTAGLNEYAITAQFHGSAVTSVPFSLKGVAPKVETPKTTEPKKETPAEEYVWKAFQTFGTCAEAIPYEDFYGQAKPGSTIKIMSDYGTTATTADASGNWSVRATFAGMSAGQTIQVKVKNYTTGQYTMFSFSKAA